MAEGTDPTIKQQPKTKTGRISFDDESFSKLIYGEPLRFELMPGTTHIEFRLDERSKYRKTYLEIFNEAVRGGALRLIPKA
jgi:hypothetical protein